MVSKPPSEVSSATRASAAPRIASLAAAAKVSRRASASNSARSRSSAARNSAGTFASNGKRCSTRSQKAWIVWIFNPPGVSTAAANSFRASSRLRGGLAPVSSIFARKVSSSASVQPASMPKTRADMLAAAALVKVRQIRRDGATPASSRRTTRCVSTCVLPEPACADTQAETSGSDARLWFVRVCAGIGYLIPRPLRLRRRPTIP